MRLIDADALLKELNKAEAGTLHSTKLVQPENKFVESLVRASFSVARLAISNAPTMSLWMTQSLLSSWIYFLNSNDANTDAAYQSFLDTLHCVPKPVTKAMQKGIDFEAAVNALVSGKDFIHQNDKWDAAVRKFAKTCAGGQAQTPVAGKLSVSGYDFTLYGICDYVKAGVIYDIKKVTQYQYGKYFNSPQHPMYLHLLPDADHFDYLIFDGSYCYRETYRRGDYTPIEQTIAEFVKFLKKTNLMETYLKNWSMNQERTEKINGIYERRE